MGVEIGGKGCRSRRRYGRIVLSDGSHSLIKELTGHRFNIRQFGQFQTNAAKDGVTGFRHGVRVKVTGGVENILEDLIQRRSEPNPGQERFGVGFPKDEVGRSSKSP